MPFSDASTTSEFSPSAAEVTATNTSEYKQTANPPSTDASTTSEFASAARTTNPRRLHYEILPRNDRRRYIPPSNLVSGDVTREHTALGTHTVDVKPTPDSINSLLFSEARLWYGDELLFRGYLLKNGRSIKTADATLEGEGIGRDLKKGSAAAVYKDTPHYRAISDYWQRYTDFDAVVYIPTAVIEDRDEKFIDTTTGDVSIQDSVSLSETDPLYIDVAGDDLVLAQSNFLGEFDGPNATTADYVNGSAEDLTLVGEKVSFSFESDYQLAAENLSLQTRFHHVQASSFDPITDSSQAWLGRAVWRVDVNGDKTDVYEYDTNDHADFGTLQWSDPEESFTKLNDFPTINSGDDVTVEFEILEEYANSDGSLAVDVISIYDSRFAYNFASSTDANNELAGPELYPDSFSKIVAELSAARNIESARIESKLSDTSNKQRWGLRNNDNEDYVYNDNTETPSADFSESSADTYGTSFTAILRFGRYTDDATETPTEGDAGQRLQDYSVYLTTNDLGVIEGEKAYEGNHLENLQQLHDDAGMRFSIKYKADNKPVESYKPGDKTASKSWTTLETDVGRDVYDYWNHVVAVGRRRPEGRLRVEKPEEPAKSAEVQRVGEVVTRKKVFPDIVDSEDELKREAASYLSKGVEGDKFDGSIDIMAKSILPGPRYTSLEDFDGRDVDLESVSYEIAAGTASGSLTFGAAQKTTETTSDIVKVKRDERDSRRSIGEGIDGEVTENPGGGNIQDPNEIDYFNDSDFGEWQDPNDILSGETSDVIEGGGAARLQSNLRQSARSESGLSNYPEPGDGFEFYMSNPIPSSGTQQIFTAWYNAGSPLTEEYRVRLDADDNASGTVHLLTGSSTFLDSVSLAAYNGDYLRFEVENPDTQGEDVVVGVYEGDTKRGTLKTPEQGLFGGAIRVGVEGEGFVDGIGLI